MNREDFPLLKEDIIYFDNSATSLKPKCVIDKITDYYTNYPANASAFLKFFACLSINSLFTLNPIVFKK